jgi:hypothetical protein
MWGPGPPERRETELDTQRTGRIFGWFFIGTFITSIPARLLFIDGLDTSWTDTVFNPGAVSDTSLKLGSILEFGVIGTNIATAVVIYPLVKRQSETVGSGMSPLASWSRSSSPSASSPSSRSLT